MKDFSRTAGVHVHGGRLVISSGSFRRAVKRYRLLSYILLALIFCLIVLVCVASVFEHEILSSYDGVDFRIVLGVVMASSICIFGLVSFVLRPDEGEDDFDVDVVRFRPESLESLEKQTNFSRDEIKNMYRGFKQECPNGTVDEDTFCTIYGQFFPQGDATTYSHFVFKSFDPQRTGTITFKEFICGLSILARGTVDEKLDWAFRLYDINGDGRISRDEMLLIVTAVYEMIGNAVEPAITNDTPKLHVDYLFQKMDLNRDGYITFEEFMKVCSEDETILNSLGVLDTVI